MKNGDLREISQLAIENCHLEIVDLRVKNGDFPVRDVNLYQRVNQNPFPYPNTSSNPFP